MEQFGPLTTLPTRNIYLICPLEYIILKINNMNEKIKKLAKNIVDLVPDPDSLQDLYDNLVHIMNKQSDYFRLISPENQIKLLFYIWSLKRSNNFEIGEFLLNQIENLKYLECSNQLC